MTEKEAMYSALKQAVGNVNNRQDRSFVTKLQALMKKRYKSREDRIAIERITKGTDFVAQSPTAPAMQRTTPTGEKKQMKVHTLKAEDFEKKQFGRTNRSLAVDSKPATRSTMKPQQAQQAPAKPSNQIEKNEFLQVLDASNDEIVKQFGSLKKVKEWARDVVGLKFAMNMSKDKFFAFIRDEIKGSANPFEDNDEEE